MTEEKISYFINKAKTIDPNNFGKKIKIGIIGAGIQGISNALFLTADEHTYNRLSLL